MKKRNLFSGLKPPPISGPNPSVTLFPQPDNVTETQAGDDCIMCGTFTAAQNTIASGRPVCTLCYDDYLNGSPPEATGIRVPTVEEIVRTTMQSYNERLRDRADSVPALMRALRLPIVGECDGCGALMESGDVGATSSDGQTICIACTTRRGL